VIGNHDVVRPVTRWGSAAARTAALLLLALPGSAYIYQGEELGLPEVTDIPDSARQDPTFRRTGGKVAGRDGCRVPLPWDRGGPSFGFSAAAAASPPAAPWLPQPAGWGQYSVAAQDGDPDSFLTLYREALRIRRRHPALGTGFAGSDSMRWLEAPGDALFFARDPGFLFLANLGQDPLRLPEFREVLLASGPLIHGATGLSDGSLPPDTAVWLSV
jgi:alpha-glucosidase